MRTHKAAVLIPLIVMFGVSSAQDFGVPTGWREPSNKHDRNSRISAAQEAIDAIMPKLSTTSGEFSGIGFWQSGNVWSVMANQDYISGTTKNKGNVVKYLKQVFSLHNNYDRYGYNDDAMWWATTAVYAYRAYKDEELLDHAIAVWKHVSQFQVSEANAKAGRISGKSFNIKATCGGKSMVGGVFWRPTKDDQAINSITTGLFLTLSAFLGEMKGDAKYKDAAVKAATWIRDLQVNSETLVLDSVNGHDCSRSPASWMFTYNSGKYIEGLAILGATDVQWKKLMFNIITASVKTSHWQGVDGIITEGASLDKNNDGVGFKGIFIRGLHEAHNRNRDNNGLRTLIHSYLDVQYNAVLELAAKGDAYSANWHGPPHDFTTWGQLAALDILTASIDTN